MGFPGVCLRDVKVHEPIPERVAYNSVYLEAI